MSSPDFSSSEVVTSVLSFAAIYRSTCSRWAALPFGTLCLTVSAAHEHTFCLEIRCTGFKQHGLRVHGHSNRESALECGNRTIFVPNEFHRLSASERILL